MQRMYRDMTDDELRELYVAGNKAGAPFNNIAVTIRESLTVDHVAIQNGNAALSELMRRAKP